jgi:hypothetical protein
MQLQQAYLSCHVPVRLCLLRLAALLRGRLNLDVRPEIARA